MNLPPRIRFLAPRDRDAIPALVASAHIALVPLGMRIPGSVPSKVYEDMASGMPVLLAADGKAADIVARAGAGLSVAPDDATAIALALRTLATAPEQRKLAGERGKAAAAAYYDRVDIAHRFIARLSNDARESARVEKGYSGAYLS